MESSIEVLQNIKNRKTVRAGGVVEPLVEFKP
jgi:hypothetical protein